MKHASRRQTAWLVVLCALLASIAGFAGLRGQTRDTIKTYTLHVDATSATAPVMVEGMYWVDGSERRVAVIRQATPFDVQLTADTVVAIVKAEDGRRIQATLTESGRSGGSGGTGASVVLIQGLAPNVDWGFVKTF